MRFALRSLLKSPGFTVVALLTLALGIGVNTSMYTLVDAFLFRAAPFPDARRIHRIIGETPQGPRYSYSEVETREISGKTSAFEALAVMRFDNAALAEPGRPAEQVVSVQASAEFFTTFGTQPFLGRAFTAAEFLPGRNQVIVLSYAFWQRHYGGDRAVVGRSVRIDGESVMIVGIMPAQFDWRFLWGTTAFWRPLNFTPEQLKSRTYRSFEMIGRLRPGITAQQVTTELAVVAANQARDFPQDYTGLKYRCLVLHEAQMDQESRQILWMLLGLSGFVLLIACANLANLQLARATLAVREYAIRAALGASRTQLILQQLTESVLLSLAGGVLGVLLAMWMNQALAASIHIANEPGGLDLPLNPAVLAVTFCVATLTGVIFGIGPAWFSSRADVVTALKSQSRGSTAGRGHHRMRQLLIVGEVTLALVLLGGAAAMQRGFEEFLHKDVGWDTKHLLTGALPMSETRFPQPADRLAFFRRIETRLAALPGVEQVALTTGVPIWGYGNAQKIHSDQQAGADQVNLPLATHTMITADFFKVLGVAFVEGHGFAANIKPEDPKVVVVNEHLAREMWPGKSALGQRLATVNGSETTWSEVIGVVRDTESAVPFDTGRVKNQVFRAVAHEPWAWIRFAIRAQSPEALKESVLRAVAEVDPDLPANEVGTVASTLDQANHNLLIVAGILQGFAALGLVLAAVGLYGVISSLVAQRTTEFGIRLALGAKPSDVLGLVLGHGLKLTALGLALGLGGAYGLSRLLGSIMPRIVSTNLFVLGTMAVLLFAIALLACWLPARRATKVDPMIALRAE